MSTNNMFTWRYKKIINTFWLEKKHLISSFGYSIPLNSKDPYQAAQMCRPTWAFTVYVPKAPFPMVMLVYDS